MKIIFKVARTELRKLFFSPVSWVLGVILITICGFYFFDKLIALTLFQDSDKRINPLFESLRASLTGNLLRGGRNGFAGSILNNLYLFVPLLTMGLINHEYNSGTSKLLFSAPVKIYQIVWGKYLSIVIYNLILFLAAFLIILVGAYSINNFDWGVAVSILLSFFLLMCTYSAIGMFMSSVSNYQIVSAISTFIVLFILNNIGTLWQEYDYIRNITYHLSINQRASRMGGLLVTTRDIMYFVAITFMFIYFTYLRLKHGREAVSNLKKAGRYSIVILSGITVIFFTSRPGYIGYWDATRENVNTISTVTQDILKQVNEGELEVTLFTNLLQRSFPRARPSSRNDFIYNVWDKYIRFKSDIKFKFVDFYDVVDKDSSFYKVYPNLTLDSIAREYAIRLRANFQNYLKPAEIRKTINLQDEGMRIVMQLKYKGKSIFLRTYDDSEFWPSEYHFAAAFKRLSTDSIPKVYVSTGNLERSIYKKGERDISLYSIEKLSRNSLINNGFEVDTINLQHNEVPDDAHSLLIADPKTNLSDTTFNNVSKYIKKGGNLLILGEIEKQHVLNPITKPLGITLMPGTLVSVTEHETPDKIVARLTLDLAYKMEDKPEVRAAYKKEFSHGHIPKRFFPGATHLQYNNQGYTHTNGYTTLPDMKVWVKANRLVSDSATPLMNISEGDYKLDSFVVASALDKHIGRKHQRIGIVGDADFLSALRYYSNNIGTEYSSWMSNGSYPIKIPKTQPKDDLFTITSKTAKKLNVFFVWIFPAVVAITGSIILIRRRRQ